jgi:ribosomal-protein-alanine N-acetyltransferase
MTPERTHDWRNGLQPLTGDLVIIRELIAADAPTLFEALSDPVVSRHISPPPPSIRAFEGFIAWAQRERAVGNGVAFGIVPIGLDHAVGLVQVRALEPTFFVAEWGFVLGRSFWSTGVFQDAAALVIRFAFETLKVHRLEARAVLDNGRGNGALKKMGAGAEAVLAKSFKRDERYDEQLLWSLIATEWEPTPKASAEPFKPTDATSLIKQAVDQTQRRIQDSRHVPTKQPPTLYPFFITDKRTLSVCPTCGEVLTAGKCPTC